MRHLLYGAFWITIYLVLAVSPLLVLLLGDAPSGRDFWRDFSVGLGFTGLSMAGLQFFLTGRFKGLTLPYGIDVVYHFHRQISIIAFFFVLSHPAILIISSPETLSILRPSGMPWRTAAGVAALASFAVIIITSVYRGRLGIAYERWRVIHGYVAVGAVALAVAHIIGVDYYTQAPLKRWFWVALASAWVLALVYIRIGKPAMMLRRPYRVEKVIRERGSSWTLVLKPDGHAGIRFKPGQFAWLTLGRSPFSIKENPFSFSSSAMRTGEVRMTIKELGDFTSRIKDTAPGTRAYIDGPYGMFTIDRHLAPGYVFIAGGVGIAPIMGMLRTLADRADKRPLFLFYCSRSWEEATFREEIAELEERLDLKTVYILEKHHEGWAGETGYISAPVMSRHLKTPERLDYEYFVCGTHLMQLAVKDALDELGVPMEQVQSESFNFI
ncbi:MAG: ferric reductase-like transmembrane domain-containing protein [Thermodesulfobacteriota bacterium]|nr:MAG: ferric reductase-like transmembrane domain-containing protein [Thermodesulfobacteriota bacterium]